MSGSKFLLCVLLFTLSPLVYAGAYEDHDISFEDMRALMENSDKFPRVRAVSNYLESYRELLDDRLEPLFKNLSDRAGNDNYRLADIENIPTLKSLIGGCIDEALSQLSKIKQRALGEGHLGIYASVMACSGFMSVMADELGAFMAQNSEFLQKQGLGGDVYAVLADARDNNRGIIDELNRYFPLLISGGGAGGDV